MGCQHAVDDKYAQLETLVHGYSEGERLSKFRAIFVLTEEGCLPCTKAFARILENHVDDTTCLFWVSAMGTGLDITPYRSSGKRVIWDYDNRLQDSGILVGSGAIILANGKIDTIVHIGNARTAAESLNYISDLLHYQRSDSLGGH